MDRNLPVNLGRVTEAAALACAKHLGKGDKELADQAAVDAMRRMFDTVDIEGTVVIGEGEMDEAPMLYIGEKVGRAACVAQPVTRKTESRERIATINFFILLTPC